MSKVVLCEKLKLTILADEETRKEKCKVIRDEQYQQYKALNLCMDLHQTNYTLSNYEFKLEVDSQKELSITIPKKDKVLKSISTLEKGINILQNKSKLNEKDRESLDKKIKMMNSKNDELKEIDSKILQLKENIENNKKYQISLKEKIKEEYINEIYTVVQNQVNLVNKDSMSLIKKRAKADFDTSKKNGLARGDRKSTSYKRDYPLLTRGRDLKFSYRERESDEVLIKWLYGITFKVVLPIKKASGGKIRHTLHEIINKKIKVCDSSIQFDNKNNIILNLTTEIDKPKSKVEFVDDLVMGVDLGIRIPAVASFNNKFGSGFFGSIDDFLRVRQQIQVRRRKLQVALKSTQGGHGRDKKLSAMNRFKNSEKNFVNTYNHTISRQIVDYALKNKCKNINLELLSFANQEKNLALTMDDNKIKKDKSTKRNWSYYDLQQKIIDKAERIGIKVRLIDPYHTSKSCSECGHFEEGQRYGKDFKCKKCGYKADADFNASKNIAKSTKYIEKKEDSQFYKMKTKKPVK